LTLKKVHRLRMSEERMLRGICGTKREEIKEVEKTTK
jgi:hypothetical protein